MNNLTKRLDQLERNARTAAGWCPPIVAYNPDIPGDDERKAAEVKARAMAAGWLPGDGIYIVLIGIGNHE